MLVAIFGTAQSEIFFQPRNLTNILNAVAILGLIASAQTIVIISGGIDVRWARSSACPAVTAAIAMLHVDVALAGIAAAAVWSAHSCGLRQRLAGDHGPGERRSLPPWPRWRSFGASLTFSRTAAAIGI